MQEIDARGLSCPEPLMLVDRALKEYQGQPIKVFLTEAYSKSNVEKFAKSKGKKVTVSLIDGEYQMVIE